MAFIKIVEHQNSTGELREIYDDIIAKRGKLAEIHKIQSLNPKSIVAHMDLYLCIMFGQSPLKRYQREMMAVVVSAANNCEYCQVHHAEALNHYWKDEEKVNQLRKDYQKVDLPLQDKLLCDYAYHLTKLTPQDKIKTIVHQLKNTGLTDRAILDANQVIAYFNYVNRVVIGLGVNLERDRGKGYKY